MGVKLFYFAKACRRHHLGILAKIVELLIRYVCGCEISSKMAIGSGFQMPHNGLGVVINAHTIIGNNVKILQNVTIGGREGSGCPIIKDNVLIGAGAVILGDITIGAGAKIGANAVVIHDVPDNSVAVGVPAVIKPIKERHNHE